MRSNIANIFFSTNIGYTHYLWGNFSGYSVGDSGDAGLSKALYRYHLQHPMYIPYTSKYGPGVLSGSFETLIYFKQVENLLLEPKILFLLREPDTNLIDTPYKMRSLSARKEIYFTMEIPASYSWKAFEASFSPSIHVKGLNTSPVSWFELKLSFRTDLSVSLYEEEGALNYEYNLRK